MNLSELITERIFSNLALDLRPQKNKSMYNQCLSFDRLKASFFTRVVFKAVNNLAILISTNENNALFLLITLIIFCKVYLFKEPIYILTLMLFISNHYEKIPLSRIRRI
jgi:hypothetical protein